MPLSIHGIGVSKGYAIGRVHKLQHNQPDIAEYTLPEALVEQEVQRLLAGLDKAKWQLRDIRARIPATALADIAAFIDTHLLMLEDSSLSKAPVQLIRTRHCNAEWALKIQHDLIVQVFEDMDDPYLRSRKTDVDHVVWRIQRILATDGTERNMAGGGGPEDIIVVADDLSPADTIVLQHQRVQAFVTEHGGPLSHTAILARSLEIPAVVGAHNIRRYLRDDETVVVDGRNGIVLTGLDELLIQFYRDKRNQEQQQRQELGKLKKQPTVTKDGIKVTLQANIELPEDLTAVRKVAADGVGLFRTEFLFMNRRDLPNEEEHLDAYMRVVKALKNHPLIIRTADLGADKQVDGGSRSGPIGNNPALGLRAIRLCLKDLDLFRPQLRAILRASAFGEVWLMLPMLSSIQELRQALNLIEETKRELQARGQRFDQHLKIGGMIEVPAAAVCADYFAHHLDFLSIGTNDLIQYTLAIDRIDDEVNYLYDPLHPAVLQLLHNTIRAGHKAGIPVSLCGEMAGDPLYTRLLLGLGLTRFSVHPASLLEIKRAIKKSHVNNARRLVKRILQTSDSQKLAGLLHEITQA